MNKQPSIGICITSLGASNADLKKLTRLIATNPALKNVKIYGDIRANDAFDSRPVKDRVNSLALASQNSDIVVAWNGGYNSIELLPSIAQAPINPDTVFVGYSDNTVLANALPATNKARGFMGPMAANWVRNPKYIPMWIDALVELYNQDSRSLSKRFTDAGLTVLQPGTMQGKIWGGNNYTFDLLQGTAFAPDFTKPFILLLEGEDFVTDKKRIWSDFVRNLDSVMLRAGARKNLRGLLLAKFPLSANVDQKLIVESLQARDYLKNVPVAYNMARGYVMPSLYLPIGEEVNITLTPNSTINFNL